jgi:hypothetical protein
MEFGVFHEFQALPGAAALPVQVKNLCQAVCAAVLAAFMLAACYDKGTLEGSRVEYVRVEGRRFEVRVAPADVEGEFRMLVVRATIVIDPNPEAERSRASNVAKPFIERTCGGAPTRCWKSS